jgi:hypothetical protein
MIQTNGGRFGGYGFYLLKSKPVFLWNLLDVKRVRWEGADGKGGVGTLKVDGKVVAEQKMEKTVPLILQWDETFDIGADTGTPVDDADYHVPFNFTGKLDKLTIAVDRPQLTPEDEKRLRDAEQGAADGK